MCAEQRWEIHTAGEYLLLRTAVTCVVTSLKLFSFRNVVNRLFSFSSMLDNDYWATEIIWKRIKSISKPSLNTHEAEKCITVMAEASGVSLFCFFLYTMQMKYSAFVYLSSYCMF